MLDNHTEGCNWEDGYQRECDRKSTSIVEGSCRLCSTCRVGYAKATDGISCAKCPETKDGMTSGILAASGILFIILFIFCALIFLKVKSATSGGHGAKTKAVHSTIKRIILTHMQIVTLCFSLSVPWPDMIVTMMNVFASLSSVSQHVTSLSCYAEDDIDVVGRQAAFLYMLTACVLFVPVLFGLILYIWWVVLVPCKFCGWMSCGMRAKLIPSRALCCFQKEVTTSRTKAASKSQRRKSFAELTMLHDTSVKTRDVWTYSIVLFVYMMYPSLIRYAMALLSCRSVDSRMNQFLKDNGNGGSLETYLRTDMEEVCWKGNHLTAVIGLAIPGLLLYGIGLPLIVLFVLWRHRKVHYMNKYVFTYGLLYSGYRKDRWWWESVVLLRKFLVIVVTAFLYEDSMQLHVMMMILIVAFALHHTYLPFHVKQSDDHSPEEEHGVSGLSISGSSISGSSLGVPDMPSSLPKKSSWSRVREASKKKQKSQPRKSIGISTGSTANITENGLLLHRLERNSLLALLLLLWAANVFVISEEQCNSYLCIGLTVACIASNVIFIIQGLKMFTKYFLARTKIAQHVSKFVGKKLHGSKTFSKVSKSMSIFSHADTNEIKNEKVTNSVELTAGSIELSTSVGANKGNPEMKFTGFTKDQVKSNPLNNGKGKGKGKGKNRKVIQKQYTRGSKNMKRGSKNMKRGSKNMKKKSTKKSSGSKDVEFHVDPGTGRRYSYNVATMETAWVDKEEDKKDENTELTIEVMAETDSVTIHTDKSGRKYSFNEKTKETKWL